MKTLFTLIASLTMLASFGYTFETNRTWASTEIFGYDRTMPPVGKTCRTDPFVTLSGKPEKAFHLDDLRVIGYKNEYGEGNTAGIFNLYVPVKNNSTGLFEPQKDESGRELAFYWYDDGTHAPGWYDSNGSNRCENLTFAPEQAFIIQGGYVQREGGQRFILETNGIVLDTGADCQVPSNTFIAVGNAWSKKVNLCDITLVDNTGLNIGGGVTLQVLKPGSLTKTDIYYWYSVTNDCVPGDFAYRAPGWYANVYPDSKISPTNNITFDLGEGFMMQGYIAKPDKPAAVPQLQVPAQWVKLAEEK